MINEVLDSSFRYKLNEKSIEILAERVIKGEFGNGNNRKKKLGYAYIEVQNKVNEILGCPKRLIEEKTIEEYAKEVIKGIYGNEEDTKKNLEIYFLLLKIEQMKYWVTLLDMKLILSQLKFMLKE